MKRQLENGKKYTIAIAGKVCKAEYHYGYLHVYRDDQNQTAWFVDKTTRKGIHLVCFCISPTPIKQFWPWTQLWELIED